MWAPCTSGLPSGVRNSLPQTAHRSPYNFFLMFHLRRPDVLPVGDLGIRRAVEKAYGLPGLPDEDDLRTLAGPWRPQRTLACLYLWKTLD
jgi:DNA-3-methyladenine glycosylase II